MVWFVGPLLPRRKLDPWRSLTIVMQGRIHTYIFIHWAITRKSRIECWIRHEIAKLQYAIKSSTCLNDGEQYLGRVFSNRCKAALSDTTLTQPRLTPSPAACHNYTKASWSTSHLFPQLCQAPPPQKKNCREELKIRHRLAAQLQQISDGLVVNIEFRMTLDGWSMAPYSEQERRQ